LSLPEFARRSLVSKIRMFLDPEHSATLDLQIMRIHERCPTTVLAHLRIGKSTSIPITTNNSNAYEAWCRRMMEISHAHFEAVFEQLILSVVYFN
jgi:hypothetical protein